MSNAAIGYGAEFGYESNTPGTYTFIAEVSNIDPGGVEAEEVDVTHLKSPDGYRERVPGLKNATPATITLNFVPSAFATLRGLIGTEKNFRIKYPDTSTDDFAGFMSALTGGALTPDGKMEATATFSKTGAPDFTAD